MRLQDLDNNWDLVVVGGGITGAGIFREAVRMGLKVLLVEQRDFSWGTSSRSAKLVHGGLRYLKEGRFLLTRESVQARERLLKEAPGLVEPLEFLMPVYGEFGPGKWALEAALSLYDLMAHRRHHRFYSPENFLGLAQHVRKEGLKGGFRFQDALVDDCRLVLRVIDEGIQCGGCALNYTSVTELVRNTRGETAGVAIEDVETGATRELSARAVMNATGAWAERLHPSPKPNLHLRPLRGSHLVFPAWVLPLEHANSFYNPIDKRFIYATPWEGAILFGTTDVDHREDLEEEPLITQEEVSYLMESVRWFFPDLDISLNKCLSTYAGIRPVLSEGKLPPSKESREHVVWVDKGLVTVTGGKLTTFQKLAWDTLATAKSVLPELQIKGRREPLFANTPEKSPRDYGVAPDVLRRLYGRYGKGADEILETASSDDLTAVPNTHTLWAELPYVAAREQVRHLSDLLLRRVRIGLLCPRGAREYLNRVQSLCTSALGWNEQRWEWEKAMYIENWESAYSVPVHTSGKGQR